MIVNIVGELKGGGAELLVRELHKVYIERGLDSYAIYLSGESEELEKNEIVFGANPRSVLNIFRIRSVLKDLSNKVDGGLIVHAHLTWCFIYVALAVFGLSNVKLIYTEHSTTNKRRSIPFAWAVERLIYGQYDRIICVSRGVYDSLSEWVGCEISNRLVTIPNGSRIFSISRRSELDGRLPRLVSIGSLSPKKNFRTAISAMSMLINEFESYTIVGEGAERHNLEKLILDMHLVDKVRLVGWSDDIEAHLHVADIQIIPSVWEGFGLAAVEGMSTGLPIVASNVDGLREVLNESNPSITLVNGVESAEEWALAIRRSIDSLRSVGVNFLSMSSRHQAEKFTISHMADSYLDIYFR